MGKYIKAPEGFIEKTVFVDLGENVMAAVYTAERCRAFADMAKKRYVELYNDKEPFDFKTHNFLFPKNELLEAKEFFVSFTPWRAKGVFSDMNDVLVGKACFEPSMLVSCESEIERTDRGLVLVSEEGREICDGAKYKIEHYETNDSQPVVVHVFEYDPKKIKMIAGTPNGTYDYRNQKQTVMGEAEYEKSKGSRVVGAFNADFFDMFGDCAPSGLCVKDGNVIANPDSKRYFFGEKKDGAPVIDTLVGDPSLLAELENAVCGINLLVCDGRIANIGIGEPFGYIAHPRTVAGIREDGSVMIMVIDGRRPWHSNGATLVDAAKLLIAHRADVGLNLDGGGSSTFIVENEDGKLEMLNHPADLHRPTEDLIRDVFNTIILVQR